MIHKTSIVSNKAKIGNNVKIGPFCVVGDSVVLMDNVELKSHVVVDGITTIGENTTIYPFASIGTVPQDLKYKGEPSRLIIGKNNVIREYVTMQPGTEADSMITTIGDNGLFMVGVHIAHDCKIGNNVIFANYSNIGGHVIAEDFVIIGGMSAVQQFVKIGSYAMIAGMSSLSTDLIPFGLAMNQRAKLAGLNLIGLRRHKFDPQETNQANHVIKELFSDLDCSNRAMTFIESVESFEQKYNDNDILKKITNFLKQNHNRPFCNF